MMSSAIEAQTVATEVNGETVEFRAEPRTLLLDALRDELLLGGMHTGCEHGVCGACTILFNGAPARSCLLFAVQAEGAEITTIEGLSDGKSGLHPLQVAFSECHALQCGFCTPGMIISSLALLKNTPNPAGDEIRTALAGNICRCTGYANIVRAVSLAAERMRP